MLDAKTGIEEVLDKSFYDTDARIIDGANPKEISGRIISLRVILNEAEAAGIDVGIYLGLIKQAWGPYASFFEKNGVPQ